MIDNEIPKYKKKKKSSISKSSEKSKHKHEYIECLLIEKGHPYRAIVCKFCGKIYDIKFFESERCEDGMRRMLDTDEVFEKYKDLEKIEIESVFQKYVPISREGGE